MSKIGKAALAIYKIIRKPVLLNRVIQDPDLWKEHVIANYNFPDGLPVLDPGQLFGDHYNENLKLFTFLDGGSLVTDITLLRGLARKFEKCSFFEIGTWRGESIINIADVADECYTLNLSDDELRQLNLSEKYIGLQGVFSKKDSKIVHLKGNSLNFDFSKLNKKFDLIFIDGSHHYHDVKNDTEKIFKYLVHDESIVVWHDYGVTPEEVRFEVRFEVLAGLDKKKIQYLYHAGHTKSAVYINKDFQKENLDSPVSPKGYYEVTINYKPVE